MAKFKAAIDSPKTKAVVEADMKMGETTSACAARPSFFINGHSFSGAYPLRELQDRHRRGAEEGRRQDRRRHARAPALYAALIKDGLEQGRAPEGRGRVRASPRRPRSTRPRSGGAPVKGAKDALVTIVQFSDFQCPFCSRVEPTIDQVMKEYAGKVRVAWRNLPLPFHNNAKPAAIAAMAANRAGQVLADARQALQEPAGPGRRRPREVRAGDRPQHGQVQGRPRGQEAGRGQVDADAATGGKIGARGTPAFFINGRFLSRRAAVRALQGHHRRGAEEGRGAGQEGHAARPRSTTPS